MYDQIYCRGWEVGMRQFALLYRRVHYPQLSSTLALHVSFLLESQIQFIETPFIPLPLTMSITQAIGAQSVKASSLSQTSSHSSCTETESHSSSSQKGNRAWGRGCSRSHTRVLPPGESAEMLLLYRPRLQPCSARLSALKLLSCLSFNFLICKMG